MTEQEYADIAAACDRLLRAADTSLGRLAIPLLHVINQHPSYMAQYAPVLRPNFTRSQFAVPNSVRTGARVGRALVRSLRSARFQLQEAVCVDVLIVSHLGNPALLNGDDDFYFGAMQCLLQERGATSALVLVNHLYNKDTQSAHVVRPFPVARVLLPRAVAPNVEAQIWRQCMTVRGQLRRIAHSLPDTVDGAVAMLASRHALSAGTAANLRLYASISEVCRLLKPRIVITTHEGDASERMIWHAARSADRKPLCVGYQHTRLLERAHAIRRSVRAPGVDCDPNVILTLGEIPHATLAASPGLDSTQLIMYGSHRRADPTKLAPFSERSRLCLVLPDGDDRECAILFEFALACARRMPEMMFALRPHPIVNLLALRSRHNALRELPDNVTLSVDRTLKEECARARYCLYRGSSAAMHAVLAGVKPFYLARADELSFDSLFGLSDWRETVVSPEDFSARVRAVDTAPDPNAARRAWSFCDRYVSQVRPEAIDELLDVHFHQETSRQSRRPSSVSSSAMSSAK